MYHMPYEKKKLPYMPHEEVPYAKVRKIVRNMILIIWVSFLEPRQWCVASLFLPRGGFKELFHLGGVHFLAALGWGDVLLGQVPVRSGVHVFKYGINQNEIVRLVLDMLGLQKKQKNL